MTRSTSTTDSRRETARVEGVRSRTITWTDPARVRFHQRGLDGYEKLSANEKLYRKVR